MASIIKNGILKHLSRFTKNLSADKINVSTLKGEGELTNLELNEDVLMDLLELPVWIRLTKAVCNKVSCKIMWTKLKSVPIYLNLDEVLVEMETCEELRPHSTHTSVPNYSSGGKYGFSDKVIDGMTVRVNSVVVNFNSKAFHASFNLTRLCLDSRTPTWQKSDLRMTRLKEPSTGELLIFKQVEWQTLRLEAKAVQLHEEFYTPLRLITNQARCRIIIKKRLNDCSILGSRLVFILDELLWVVTDSQLRAAAHFANSLSGLILKATQLSQKVKAARKLESTTDWHNQSFATTSQPQRHTTSVDTVLSRVFNTYDVHETSYHFYSGQIDLHLCDEVTPDGINSSHPSLSEGGAIQIALENISIDYYPYHLSSSSRKYWLRYKENSTARQTWVAALLADFRTALAQLLPGESPKHAPLARAQAGTDSGHSKKSTPTKISINNYLARLMTACLVLRVDELSVFSVSTPNSRSSIHRKFVSSDKGRLMLPQDMSSVHLEWTQFYYPGDSDLPVPAPNLFVQINSLSAIYDDLTLLWLNCFGLSLRKAILDQPQTVSSSPKMDIRIEGLMPRVVFIDTVEHPSTQSERPRKLQLQIARLTATNSRIGEFCGRMDLANCLERLQSGELLFCDGFPTRPGDPHPVEGTFVEHSMGSDRARSPSKTKSDENDQDIRQLLGQIEKDLLFRDEKNVWCVHMDPMWADFAVQGTPSRPKPRPLPFLDAFPLTLWVYEKQRENFLADLYMLAHVNSLVNIQINHYQYLFILRMLENLSETTKQLATDTARMTKVGLNELPATCVAVRVPEIDVSLVVNNTINTEDREGSMDNCDSLINDDTTHRRRSGIRESASEHVDLKTNENGNMSKSRSDSLLDSRSIPNGSPTDSSHDICALPEEEIHLPERNNPLTDLSDNLTKTLASGSSAMKKGLFSIRSSIDSAITSSKASLQSLDRKTMANSPDDVQSLEDWETVSVRSDLSSDSDQFMMVHLDNQTNNKAEDALFRSTNVAQKIEKASEIKETPTTTSSCSVKRTDLVSVLTLRMGDVEVIENSQGHDSLVRVLCRQMESEGQNGVTWDEFQTKFSARSRGWQEISNGLWQHKCDVRIRYEVGPIAEKVAVTAGERGVTTAVVSGVDLNLFSSAVVGIPDLIEDEIIPLPMPMRLYLRNVNINLQDDRPPVNVTSPGPIPIDLSISNLSIIREADGIFNIKRLDEDIDDLVTSPLPTPISRSVRKSTQNVSTSTENDENRDISKLMEENKQLKMKLLLLSKFEIENERLQEIVAMETVKAASAMQRLEEVEEENKSLMATRQVLQQELIALETRHNSFSTHNATG